MLAMSPCNCYQQRSSTWCRWDPRCWRPTVAADPAYPAPVWRSSLPPGTLEASTLTIGASGTMLAPSSLNVVVSNYGFTIGFCRTTGPCCAETKTIVDMAKHSGSSRIHALSFNCRLSNQIELLLLVIVCVGCWNPKPLKSCKKSKQFKAFLGTLRGKLLLFFSVSVLQC